MHETLNSKNTRSRIDLLLESPSENEFPKETYIEVKNTTWREGSTALFPDTVTKRGQKHLTDLIEVLPSARSILIPCISRDDLDCFAPGDSADIEYGHLFRKAIRLGVDVIPCAFGFHQDKITWEGKRSYRTSQLMND